jgi:hypothetical protein
VNAALLALDGGKYRCGKCRKMGKALDSLFDEWPAAGERPPARGEPPVLGISIDLDKARKSRLTSDDAAPGGDASTAPVAPANARGKRARFTWIAMVLVIAAILSFKLYEIRPGMHKPLSGQVFRDLSQIQLVSRELTNHPVQADTLRLTATIVNRAPEIQPYPDLEVILLDLGGQAVSRLRLSPSDYLAEGSSKDSGMTPQAYLPLVLDLPDPGREAVGFELNFL